MRFIRALLLVASSFMLVQGQGPYSIAAPSATYAAEGAAVLRGSGINETSNGIAKVFQAVQDGVGHPIQIEYRVVSQSQAQTDFVATPSSTLVTDFGINAGPLSSTNFAAAAGVTQVPFSYMTVSVFFNLPNTTSISLNPCILAKILTGGITTWNNPTIQSLNTAFTLNDPSAAGLSGANIFLEGSSTAPAVSTQALFAYLAAGNSGCTGTSWSSSTTPSVSPTYGSAATVASNIAKTPYSIGVLMSYAGKAAGLTEASVLTNSASEYVTSKNFNSSTTQAAVQTALGTSYTTDVSSVTPVYLTSTAKVYPLIVANYFYCRNSQTNTGDKGAALVTMLNFLLSSAGQALLTANNQLGFTSSALTTFATAASGITLQSGFAAYTLDTSGASAGASINALSTARLSSTTILLNNMQNQINALQFAVTQAGPKLLRGSGSSAVAQIVWRNMDVLMSQATTPVWMSYRGIGSGGGESEIASNSASATATVVGAVDFGCSDVPMDSKVFAAMNALIPPAQVVQIPMFILPLAMFVNLPPAIFPAQKMQLSACTLAAMFQGSVTKWNDPLIQADNPTVNVSALNYTIIPGYRSGSSGTNAVWSAWMSSQCTSGWTLSTGSQKVLPQSASYPPFSPNAKGVGSSTDMINLVSSTPWSIGYVDAGLGQSLGLMEIAVKNAAGTWLTTSSGSGWPTADISAAATQLYLSGTWPTSPTATYSSVSLINQPGNATWPITSAPFMFVRVDSTARGASGPLLLAFINYMLGSGQSYLTSQGFGTIPSVVLSLVLSTSVPLISVNNAFPSWFNETTGGNKFTGAGDAVFAQAKDTYIRNSVAALMTSAAAAQLAASKAAVVAAAAAASGSGSSGTNLSGFNISSLAGLSTIQSTQNNQNNQIQILQNIAIASLVFALVALGIAIFAIVRLMVLTTTGTHNGGMSGVMPGSMNAGSVKGTGSFHGGNDSGLH